MGSKVVPHDSKRDLPLMSVKKCHSSFLSIFVGKPLYGDVFGTSDGGYSQQMPVEEVDQTLWGEMESESEEEESEEEQNTIKPSLHSQSDTSGGQS